MGPELSGLLGSPAEWLDGLLGPVVPRKAWGDAAMFVSPKAGELTEALVELRERVHAYEALPDVRIGAAFGPATPRAGDWFGSVVNTASRVADAASRGQLLATQEFVARVGGEHWKKRRKRNLKGLERRLRLYSYGPTPRRRGQPRSARRCGRGDRAGHRTSPSPVSN